MKEGEGILKCLHAIQFEVSEAPQQMGSFMWKLDSQASPYMQIENYHNTLIPAAISNVEFTNTNCQALFLDHVLLLKACEKAV